jgi:ribosomal protein S15P/S13E
MLSRRKPSSRSTAAAKPTPARRKLLDYLKQSDQDRYSKLITDLGLRR